MQVCRLKFELVSVILCMAKLIFCKGGHSAVIGQTNSYEITAVAAAGMGVCLCKDVIVIAHF